MCTNVHEWTHSVSVQYITMIILKGFSGYTGKHRLVVAIVWGWEDETVSFRINVDKFWITNNKMLAYSSSCFSRKLIIWDLHLSESKCADQNNRSHLPSAILGQKDRRKAIIISILLILFLSLNPCFDPTSNTESNHSISNLNFSNTSIIAYCDQYSLWKEK